jgi:glucose dehydrogenase
MSFIKSLGHTLCIAGAMLAASAAHADPQLQEALSNPKNWAVQAGNFANHRYSELNQINKDNVKNLQVAWTFSTGVLRGHEGGPLVIGDVMYLHSPFPNKVFAINLEDKSLIWKYEPKQDPSVISIMCCDTVNRGLAFADGKIILQQADTTLVALDAKQAKRSGKSSMATPRRARPIRMQSTYSRTR